MTGVPVITASLVQSIECRWQAQTLTKKKAMGMKGVVSRVKDRGLDEDKGPSDNKDVPAG